MENIELDLDYKYVEPGYDTWDEPIRPDGDVWTLSGHLGDMDFEYRYFDPSPEARAGAASWSDMLTESLVQREEQWLSDGTGAEHLRAWFEGLDEDGVCGLDAQKAPYQSRKALRAILSQMGDLDANGVSEARKALSKRFRELRS